MDQAEAGYRSIHVSHPDHPEPLHLLGLIAHQQGNHQTAIDFIQHAISQHHRWPEASYNLGIALFAQGRTSDAIAAYQQAIAFNPNFADAYNSLGNALKKTGELNAAAKAFDQAIIARPSFADAHNNLGNALRDLGQTAQAITAYRRAILLKPNYAEAFNNLAVTLHEAGEFDQAIANYRLALALKADYAEAASNLGIALRQTGQLEASVASHAHAISIKPDWAEARSGLANALVLRGELDQAIAEFQIAVTLKPTLADAHYGLGKTFFDAGEVDRATKSLRDACGLEPQNISFASAMLYAMHYDPACSPEAITKAHIQWARKYAASLAKFPHPARSEHRRLRIGYVSPDFRNHPVGRFMLPLLQHHDRRAFEIFCYCDVLKPDAITARLRDHADHWHDTAKLDHQQLAELIHQHQIDILVDLTGHTTGSRLLTFARNPAAVQVSYLGYPGTTGMAEIDFRLTDSITDPPGSTEHYYSESLQRLPNTLWCYAEHEPAPPIAPPPSQQSGLITFGSFNNFAKVTDFMLELWARILQSIPNSCLFVKAPAMVSELARNRARKAFIARGIDAGRITLAGPQPDHTTHLAAYGQVDIALDTFPYHGTTTTCDTLWMGVPVITLAGQNHTCRGRCEPADKSRPAGFDRRRFRNIHQPSHRSRARSKPPVENCGKIFEEK